ncbi:MAG: LuxR C-terminal-related transcriptional regulator, partial [Actinomycetota bacterium]
LGVEEHVARTYVNLGCMGLFSYDYDIARRYFGEGLEYCAGRDLDPWSLYIEALQARVDLEQGQWDLAFEAAQGLVHRRRVEAPLIKSVALAVTGGIRARRGDPDPRTLDESLDLVRATGESDRIGHVLAIRTEAAWLAGDQRASLEEATHGIQLAFAAESRHSQSLAALWLARVGGEPPRFDNELAPVRLELDGDLEGAATAWEAVNRVYDAALCRGKSPDKDSSAWAALRLMEFGAKATIVGLNRDRRAAGLPLLPRGPRGTSQSNPAGLTPRELDVLRLLHQGLRNFEIAEKLVLSEKTVDHHVSAILRKLGVRTRAAAAARAPELMSP